MQAHQSSGKEVQLCSCCEKPASKSCSGCKSAFYCSEPCQKADWKKHKVLCKSLQEQKAFEVSSVPSQQLIKSELSQELVISLGDCIESLTNVNSGVYKWKEETVEEIIKTIKKSEATILTITDFHIGPLDKTGKLQLGLLALLIKSAIVSSTQKNIKNIRFNLSQNLCETTFFVWFLKHLMTFSFPENQEIIVVIDAPVLIDVSENAHRLFIMDYLQQVYEKSQCYFSIPLSFFVEENYLKILLNKKNAIPNRIIEFIKHVIWISQTRRLSSDVISFPDNFINTCQILLTLLSKADIKQHQVAFFGDTVHLYKDALNNIINSELGNNLIEKGVAQKPVPVAHFEFDLASMKASINKIVELIKLIYSKNDDALKDVQQTLSGIKGNIERQTMFIVPFNKKVLYQWALFSSATTKVLPFLIRTCIEEFGGKETFGKKEFTFEAAFVGVGDYPSTGITTAAMQQREKETTTFLKSNPDDLENLLRCLHARIFLKKENARKILDRINELIQHNPEILNEEQKFILSVYQTSFMAQEEKRSHQKELNEAGRVRIAFSQSYTEEVSELAEDKKEDIQFYEENLEQQSKDFFTGIVDVIQFPECKEGDTDRYLEFCSRVAVILSNTFESLNVQKKSLETTSDPSLSILTQEKEGLDVGIGNTTNLQAVNHKYVIQRLILKLPKIRADCFEKLMEVLGEKISFREFGVVDSDFSNASVPTLLKFLRNNPDLNKFDLRGNYFSTKTDAVKQIIDHWADAKAFRRLILTRNPDVDRILSKNPLVTVEYDKPRYAMMSNSSQEDQIVEPVSIEAFVKTHIDSETPTKILSNPKLDPIPVAIASESSFLPSQEPAHIPVANGLESSLPVLRPEQRPLPIAFLPVPVVPVIQGLIPGQVIQMLVKEPEGYMQTPHGVIPIMPMIPVMPMPMTGQRPWCRPPVVTETSPQDSKSEESLKEVDSSPELENKTSLPATLAPLVGKFGINSGSVQNKSSLSSEAVINPEGNIPRERLGR